MYPPRPPLASLAALTLAIAACGGNAPTETGGNGGTSPTVASVDVSPSSSELEALDATVELSAVARDADGNTLPDRTFEWSSTDDAVVTVDAEGVATASANGNATVRATTGDVSGEAEVTVGQVAARADVSPATATLESAGETQQFLVESTDANAHPVEGATYTWTSSMESVATVDDAGVATAVEDGEAHIIATVEPGGAADSARLTVNLSASQGDAASLRDVVISEVNWFGNGDDVTDEWIELRNISGSELDLSGWMLEGAGSGSDAITLKSGTVLADGEYLVLAELQGPDSDGQRTSLTGVAGVQLHSISLLNDGEELVLRDIEGTFIDATPTGNWPAGDATDLYSMERRDDLTGGDYTAGDDALSWYTWNSADGTDTTHSDTADSGTPGADNSDPTAT